MGALIGIGALLPVRSAYLINDPKIPRSRLFPTLRPRLLPILRTTDFIKASVTDWRLLLRPELRLAALASSFSLAACASAASSS